MIQSKPLVHFTDKYILDPTNPLLVNLIGAGGNGSHVLSALGTLNYSLNQLGHPGLQVTLFDDDLITSANPGRQQFADSEIGLHKAPVLISRINRFFGTNWKSVTRKYSLKTAVLLNTAANITISCVDTTKARFEIAEILSGIVVPSNGHDRTLYWIDFGNSRHTGQVILSTVGEITQPTSSQYDSIGKLPFITEEFRQLLLDSETDNTPSCSHAESLTKQDLFINPSIATMGISLLYNMIREGMLFNRGFFHNLKDFRTQPIRIN
jgi:PRTRC genetic system ThiF family protein